MTADDPLDAASEELYAGPPADFVARRDALAAEAGAAGDRALATALKKLRRPTIGAWYLNTAARAGLISLRELLKLGEELRAAQSTGDLTALRDLAARRGPLVSRVLRDLTGHLAERGTTATPAGLDEVRRTLAAALADPEVADVTRRGRLDRAHDYSGFGPVVVPTQPTSAPASTAPAKPAAAAAPDDKAAGRAAAETAVEQAQAALAAATAELTDEQATLDQARTRADELAAELERATAEVAGREASVNAAAERERRATEALDRARQALARFED